MVPLLRKGLVCFYCGCRSKQKQDGTIRKWQCKNCDAVNHLDENGEIADYVPPSPQVKVRFADPQPAFSLNDSNKAFCSMCLKNQHLLTQALAAYLPSPTDPRYPAYEASYPEYRQKLEERYPQVCPTCEEGVTKQIRQAEYMANTEYLRRKIEATRNGARRTLARSWGWRRLLVYTGGVTWLTSLLLQGLWHIHAARAHEKIDDGLIGDMDNMTLEGFFRGCVLLKDEGDCLTVTADLARVSLAMAVGSVWWNNQLWRKTLGTWIRLAGLEEYYTFQFTLLVLRTAAWWIVQLDTFKGLKKEAQRAYHIAAVAVFILSTIISLRIVKVKPEPRVSFRKNVGPLAPRQEKQQVTSAPAPIYPTPPNSQATYLNPLPSPLFTRRSSPPVGDADEMDWTPSQEQQPFNPNPHSIATLNAADPPQQGPSPFYGRLPAQPISPAARLRNPPNKPHLRKITDNQKETLVSSMRGHSSSEDNEDTDGNGKKKAKRHTVTFSDPRFFPEDRSTGLESLFNNVLTVGDEPPEVVEAIRSQQRQAGGAGDRTASSGSSTSIKPEKLWKEWIVPALLVVPVLMGLQWVVCSIWGIWERIFGVEWSF
ncbi:hypothetical protein FGG08_007012 [Glutinoglossum americanum]|uniref:Ima1 N-terminal domain-containing protein n=1 Tax=Glutinoglossum americanum TaxID=1670608 RepID=A0A9P8I056_9PEZI|nr:hypothetical protein FGG08_007012 [Glutinoglossum americanum]